MTKKEGRNKKSAVDMSSECGRQLIWTLENYKKTGFNPYDPDVINNSTKLWRSDQQYMLTPPASFQKNVRKFAEIVISQWTPSKRIEAQADAKSAAEERKRKERGEKNESKKTRKIPRKKKKATEKKSSIKNKGSLPLRPPKLSVAFDLELGKDSSTRSVQRIRDSMAIPLPSNKRALVLFEPDGDVNDVQANKLEFSPRGTRMFRFSRIPAEMLSSKALIGDKNTDDDFDADCMLLEAELDKRFGEYMRDDNDSIWTLREVIELPFECHKSCYDKYGRVLETYLHRSNSKGYVWAYFWVLSATIDLENPAARIVGADIKASGQRIEASVQRTGDCDDDDISTIGSGGFSDDGGDDKGSMDLDSTEGKQKNSDSIQEEKSSREKLEDRVKELEDECVKTLEKAMEIQEGKEGAEQKIEVLKEAQATLLDQIETAKRDHEQLESSLEETQTTLQGQIEDERNLRMAKEVEASRMIESLKESAEKMRRDQAKLATENALLKNMHGHPKDTHPKDTCTNEEVADLMNELKKEYDNRERLERNCRRYQEELKGSSELRDEQEKKMRELQELQMQLRQELSRVKQELQARGHHHQLQEELLRMKQELRAKDDQLQFRPTEGELQEANSLRAQAEAELLVFRTESLQKIKAEHEAKLLAVKGNALEHIRRAELAKETAEERVACLRNTNKSLDDQIEVLESEKPKRKRRRSERIENRSSNTSDDAGDG